MYKELGVLMCLAVLMAGCGKEKLAEAIPAASAPSAASGVAAERVAAVSAAEPSSPAETEEPMPADLLQQFAWHGRQVSAKLAKSTPQQADALFDEYSAMLDVYNEKNPSESGILVRINDQEKDVLDDYMGGKFWTDDGKPTLLLKKRMQKLADVGLEYWDIGQGMAVVRPVPDYYLRLFGKYVTPDYRRYLETDARQAKELDINDESIAIGWQAFADRIAAWEDFLQRYPDSNMVTPAQDKYLFYQAVFLLGLDNAPTYSDNGSSLYGMGEGEGDLPDAKKYLQARQDYMKKHPDSHMAKLLSLTEGLNREQAKNAVIEYQKKHFGKASAYFDTSGE